jgi:hypothetical protein
VYTRTGDKEAASLKHQMWYMSKRNLSIVSFSWVIVASLGPPNEPLPPSKQIVQLEVPSLRPSHWVDRWRGRGGLRLWPTIRPKGAGTQGETPGQGHTVRL